MKSALRAEPQSALIGVGFMPVLQPFNHGADFFFAPTEPLLHAPEHFVFLAFGEYKVVIRQLAILLLEFAFEFVPVAFEV